MPSEGEELGVAESRSTAWAGSRRRSPAAAGGETTTTRRTARLLAGLALLATTFARASRAAGPGECLGSWLVGTALRDTATVVCRDGDPTCDVDAAADGTCVVRARYCLGRTACAAGPATTLAVRGRGSEAVGRAAAALVLPAPDGGACTDSADVVVALGRRRRAVATAIAMAGAAGARDRDRLRVVCERAGTPGAARAVVVTTNFETGILTSVGVAPPRRVRRLDAQIHEDAVVRTSGGMVFVLNRFLGDSVQRLDPEHGLASRFQCSTVPGSNPHDIVVTAPDTAFVTRYDRTQLWVVDPSVRAGCDGFQRGAIDLAELADADGLPEMDQMVLAEGRLFVSVQRLDRAHGFAPNGPSRLAVIDPATWTLTATITLPGANAFGDASGIAREPGTGKLVLSTPGDIYRIGDGGLVRVDPTTLVAEPGFFVREEQLGGNILDFVLVSPTKAYAVVQDGKLGNHLVTFDPTGATPPHDLFSRQAYLPDVALAPDGTLWLADQTLDDPGIRIFDVRTDRPLTRAPIAVGLPPFSLGFVP